MRARGTFLVISAPSGCGKTTVSDRLLSSDANLVRAVTVTTRAPRPGEVDGVHYFFRSMDQFEALVRSGGMLEHATVFGKGYGVPRGPVEDSLSSGRDVLAVVDWQGHRSLKEAMPNDVLGVFLVPPSLAELGRRLRGRGADDGEAVARRLAEADVEMSHSGEFDHEVLNDVLEDAVEQVRGHLERRRSVRRRALLDAG
jgi:guanylate kinase